MFAKHHYLSHSHNKAATVYVALINNQIAGFLSVLPFPHPIVRNFRKVHRLVILPDYQGAGFGIKFLNEIGEYYKKNKYRFTIVTSAPSLIYALKKATNWACKHFGRKSPQLGALNRGVGYMGSSNRITVSFELK